MLRFVVFLSGVFQLVWEDFGHEPSSGSRNAISKKFSLAIWTREKRKSILAFEANNYKMIVHEYF